MNTNESIIRESCEREKEKIFMMLLVRRPTRRFCRETLLSYIYRTYMYYIRKHSYTYTWKSRATFHTNTNVGRDRIYTITISHYIPITGISQHKLSSFCPWETYRMRLSTGSEKTRKLKWEIQVNEKRKMLKKKERNEW